jgi:adenylate cyclase
MARVFLSYAREDADRARLIAAALERDSHSVWWDEHIPGGDEFGDVIEKQLAEADAVVALWSATSVKSPWVRDEAGTGRDRGCLVPVTLDGTLPPLGFRQFQTVNLSRWNGRANSSELVQLTKAVRDRAGTAAQRSASETPSPAKRRFSARPAVAIGAVGGLALLGAAAFFGGLLPSGASASVTPTVVLGSFTAGAGTQMPLAQTLTDEILAAFGSEHELTLVRGGGAPGQFLLDGSVQKTADSLRFNITLTNSRTGGLVWSQAFDRALEDSLAARQVAVAATQVVRCGIWGASSFRKPMSDQALGLYIDWCNAYWGGSPDEDRILDAARRVSAALPDFSYAWSALALSAVPVSHRAGYGEASAVAKEGWQAAEKAILLNRSNPEGYMAEAGLLPRGRFAERERLLRQAIKARPTECGCERQSYGDFLTSVGRNSDAVGEYDRARAMMPLAPMSNVRLAQALYLVGRTRDGDEVVSKMLDVWPDAEIIRTLQLKAALWTGRYGEARAVLESGSVHLADSERDALLRAFAALQSQSPADTAAAVADLSRLASDPRFNDRLIVAALAALKAYPQAFDAADRLIRERGPALADVLFEPNLAPEAGSAEFAGLVRRLGLADYWASTGRLPDLCSASRRSPPFCKSERGR